jgi:hypothetical protein
MLSIPAMLSHPRPSVKPVDSGGVSHVIVKKTFSAPERARTELRGQRSPAFFALHPLVL